MVFGGVLELTGDTVVGDGDNDMFELRGTDGADVITLTRVNGKLTI